MEARAALPLHRLHDEDIERLLTSGERKAELTALFGPEGYRELSALARRAAEARTRAGQVVYLLPGLMGSRIGTPGRLLDDVIWLDPIEVVAGHLTRLALPRGAKLAALGVMLLNSLKLKFSLTIAGFDARLHAYDWRRSVERLALELVERMAADGVREPMVVGHSLGGVVARLALAMDGGRIARAVQLGSPNHGSFAPVLALRGVYPTVRKLAALDLRHDAEDLARIIFRTLPSLHELLPDASRTSGPDLFDAANWPGDALGPSPELLEEAAAARRRWPSGDDRCLHVVGVRQETVTHVELAGAQFVYHFSTDGDGTVPRILAEVPGSRCWYASEKHGGLPNNGKVISAVVDLLRDGTTPRLPASHRVRAGSRRSVPESVLRRVAPHKVRWQDLSPDARRRLLEPVVSPEFHGEVPDDVLRARPAQPATSANSGRRPIEIRLSPGSLVDANARALVLGVFRNVDPAGASRAVDERLGGTIREFTLRRMFGGDLGQVSILPSTRHGMLAEFVLLAGLGDFDELGPDAQSFVAENVVRTLARTRVEDFATVLFGTGSGIPVATALEQQLAGFFAGLRHADPERVIRRITLCEIDGRRFATLRRLLPLAATKLAGDDFKVVVDEVAPASDRPEAQGRKPARRTRTEPDPAYLLVSLTDSGRSEHECRASLLTAGAKAAVLSGSVRVNRSELRETLALANPGTLTPRGLARYGAALARMLLARPVREGLESVSRRPLVIVHDRESSRVPWEVLGVGDAHPALTQGLSRRYASEGLTVARWREDRHPGDKPRVLLVVDPTLDLPGASREGAALRRILDTAGAPVNCLTGREATRARLLREIGAGGHDILHFAGHAFFDATDPGKSGLVCAGTEVLRGSDLDGVADLPSLVFCNACEAARVRKPSLSGARRLLGLRRSSSLAEAFLDGGVANFIGTHWPVGDDAALNFSTTFYGRLLEGHPLGDAMLAARRRVFDLGSIDWADYVHYGNPAFRFANTPD
jgi:pimeloyl-ACP methyl ester carboxylesterase